MSGSKCEKVMPLLHSIVGFPIEPKMLYCSIYYPSFFLNDTKNIYIYRQVLALLTIIMNCFAVASITEISSKHYLYFQDTLLFFMLHPFTQYKMNK